MLRAALVFALLMGCACATSAVRSPIPLKTPDQIPDALTPLLPSQVQLDGFLGQRVSLNEKNRLLAVDEEELLAGFRNRPGKQAWIGEHVGKFLHAATLAWANTGDQKLRAKIDRVAAELIKCQEPDGYLGTYLPKDHWTSWDVWVHKYNLIGLLTYHQYTGDTGALDCSRKMADLLITTFPAQKSIIKAGTHVGMAATSVLEPVVLLYRITAEPKYLDFAKYLVRAYDEPNGPKIIASLLESKSVRKTANGKAYEMMSNLVGLCELARATGDKSYLVPLINAWEDIVAHQLYITGASSHGEHFGEDDILPNSPKFNIGETCVTTTWIQLNAQLLRLTGEARFGHELERSYYNHLSGAQLPDGSKWCYYTPLQGAKPYGNSTNCCLSSGPRALALAPQLAILKFADGDTPGIAINSLDSFSAAATIEGRAVTIRLDSQFPRSGSATLTLGADQPVKLAVKVRQPDWARPIKCSLGGQELSAVAKEGWIILPVRTWSRTDQVVLTFSLAPRIIPGQHNNQGYSALTWGPMVLAYDTDLNPGLPQPQAIALASAPAEGSAIKPLDVQALTFSVPIKPSAQSPVAPAVFVPFTQAGAGGGRFSVWISQTNRAFNPSLLSNGNESRSREGNRLGSINDGEDDSFVVTFDGQKQDEDFFAVTLDKPITINRIVYMHGGTFHDGGWFDGSAGKPKIQVQRSRNSAWETIGELTDYPATTATSSANIKKGQEFTLKLPQPVEAWGVRIIGKPACGDNPRQSFSSCAELQAFKN